MRPICVLTPALLLIGACADAPPPPLTAAEATAPSTEMDSSLVTYLGQRDASAAVCDLHAAGPHVMRLGPSIREAFVDGLVSGRISPEIWHDCAAAFLESAPAEDAALLIDEIGKGYRSLLLDSAFERSSALQLRVANMQRLYLERDNRIRDAHPAFAALIADLRIALAGNALGPIASHDGSQLVNAVDAEAGKRDGRPVDVAALDGLTASGDEATLHVLMRRLPDPELRKEAERRIVRLHIAHSPRPEVRADAPGVEERLMTIGTNAIALEKTPPTRSWLDLPTTTMSGVLVREDLARQTAAIVGYGDLGSSSIFQELELRNVLFLELPGLSAPITLCGPAGALDPTPCVAPSEITIGSSLASLGNDGKLHFETHLPMTDAVALMAMHDHLTLPFRVGEQTLLTVEWPFHYARPADMDFAFSGPRLTVHVDHRDSTRYRFTVKSPFSTYLAVVEAADVRQFHVISRGTPGANGLPGWPGYSGASGGICGSGENGTNGGPGGNGGNGGNGGDIEVEVECGYASCDDVIATLHGSFLSPAGPGGAAGPGGLGGRGGAGGSDGASTSTTAADGTTITIPGCTGGAAGTPGLRGPDGMAGVAGKPGRVTIRAMTN